MALENDYEVLERLGEGAFGKVYKARHRRTDDMCAVKQIKLGAKSWDEALRSTELQALKALRHPFIVRLRELLRSSHDGSLYYIFEFIGSDLCRLMRQYPQGLEEPRAAELTRQVFAGLAHVHQHNFFHRDIKPENILFDTERETIRIADFGEARSVRARPPFTDYVGTRWYRAPECLLRDRTYSSPVDIWASGLVFIELLRGAAVFCGTSSIDQLYKIFQVLGQPVTDWPEFKRLAEACRFRVPESKGCGLQRVVPKASAQAQAVLGEILSLNPRRRPLARKVLEHSFFASLPPLDLDRLDTCRSTQPSVASGGPGEERLHTQRSVPQTAASSRPQTEASRANGCSGTPPRTPPSPTQESARNLSRRVTQEVLQESIVAVPTDDLDLDAELDKILGGSIGIEPANRPPPPGPTTNDAQAADLPPRATHPPPATPGNATARSTSAGSFKFAPTLRDASGSRTDCDDGARNRGDSLSMDVPTALTASIASVASPEPEDSPRSPASPGGRSVEALLDSLCADLGVDGERSRAPAQAAQTVQVLPQPPPQAAPPMAPDAQLEVSSSSSPNSRPPPSLDANPALRSRPSRPPLLNPATSSTLKFAGVTASKHAADTGGDLEDPSSRKEDQFKGVVPNASRADEHMGQAMEQALCATPSGNCIRQACEQDLDNAGDVAHDDADDLALPGLGGCVGRSPALVQTSSVRDRYRRFSVAEADASHPQFDGKVTPLVTETVWEVDSQPRRALSQTTSQAWGHTSALERPVSLYTGVVNAYPATPSMAGRGAVKDHLTSPSPDVELCTLGETGRTSRGFFSIELEDIVAETPAEAMFQTDANAVGGGRQRAPSRPLPWSSEEASQLRRVVKRVIRRGIREKEVLWQEVSREHGNGRGPRECKLQYTRDYKAHKASAGAGSAPESRPQQLRRAGSMSRGRGRTLDSQAPHSAHAAV
mmetsp:Transcript_76108/g.150472  ORF Transcript_76108/g.150472 Transcript_76108/m.150472 type:complete len:945 (-) Transcript_76108:124-2958(-)